MYENIKLKKEFNLFYFGTNQGLIHLKWKIQHR